MLEHIVSPILIFAFCEGTVWWRRAGGVCVSVCVSMCVCVSVCMCVCVYVCLDGWWVCIWWWVAELAIKDGPRIGLWCSDARSSRFISTAGRWSWKWKAAEKSVTTHLPNGLTPRIEKRLHVLRIPNHCCYAMQQICKMSWSVHRHGEKHQHGHNSFLVSIPMPSLHRTSVDASRT